MIKSIKLFFILTVLIITLFISCDSNGTQYDVSKEPQLILEIENVFNLDIDNEGAIWFSSRNQLYKYDNELTEINSQNSNLSDGKKFFEITSGSDGTLWFGSDYGLIKYADNYFTYIDSTNSHGSNNVITIKEDYNNCIWYCDHSGLNKLDQNNISTIRSEEFDVTYLFARSLEIDANNNLWMVVGDRLYKINDQNMTKFENADLYNCNNIAFDKYENLWLTCDYSISSIAYTDDLPKIFVYNHYGTWKEKDPSIIEGDRFFPFKMITDSRGIIWISNMDELLLFDGESWDKIEIGQAVWDICEDNNGDLLLGTSNGIYFIEVN